VKGCSDFGAATLFRLLSWREMDKSTIPYALAVDDDPFILKDTHDILVEAGFRCHEAHTGDEAITLLEEHADSIVLLFSDVEMPGETDGFGLARYVDEHWPHIEIVIASGRIMPEAGDMPSKATFLGKPFNAAMVHDHLREKLPDGVKPEPLKTAV
jgi:CheY-like chemotaxis protein